MVVVGLLLVSGESFLQPGSPKGSGCCEPQPVPHSPSFFLWLSFPLSYLCLAFLWTAAWCLLVKELLEPPPVGEALGLAPSGN